MPDSPEVKEEQPAYLRLLNPTQQEIVENTQGALLVLAGAGTGKTKTLTTRVAHILSLGLAQPDEIFCVTFTNKAANEMKLRIQALIGATTIANMPWLGTFHGLGAKFLRRHAKLINIANDFDIIDKADSEKLLKKLITEQNHSDMSDKTAIAKNIRDNIERWKGRAILPEESSAAEYIKPQNEHSYEALTSADDKFLTPEFAQKIYQQYQQRLKEMNLCDFGDLLMYPVKILQTHADMLAYYQQKLRYILVDEYQDTNLAQYLFLRLLAQKPDNAATNICCVGDDDQSIYGWRGAKVEHMLRFTSDFPQAKIIRLERNYRSEAHILDSANRLIARNEQRLGKILYPDKKAHNRNAKIYYHQAFDSVNEAQMICQIITSLHYNGQKLNNIAILVRSRTQLRELEGALANAKISYRLIGETNLYSKSEAKDILSYLRLIAQPKNDIAFERILNTPRRGVGKVSLEKIRDYARQENLALSLGLSQLLKTPLFKNKLHQTLDQLARDFARWRELAADQNVSDLAYMILHQSGYKQMLENSGLEGREKLENLQILIDNMREYSDLNAYLETVALATEKAESPDVDAINLMTMHASKGLEFNTVLLPGWEEGLFPSPRQADIEEERRLAYVALTRAKDDIYISHAQRRRVYGEWAANSGPSRFIKELPRDLIQDIADIPAARHKPIAQPILNTPHNFRLGQRINNVKLGPGTVIAINQEKLGIEFDSGETRIVIAKFVKPLKASQ